MLTHHRPPQLPTLTDDFLGHPEDVRQCELNFRKKRKHAHTHTLMHRSAHSPTQAIDRMTLAQLKLNYIAATVSSISMSPSVILSSIMPLHPSSISHPLSPPSFSFSPLIHSPPILVCVCIHPCVLFRVCVIFAHPYVFIRVFTLREDPCLKY